MFLWDETIAKRGSAEITSCVWAYVLHTLSPLPEGKTRNLIIWSDRCIGQNNNWKLIALMQHLIMKRYFTTVQQKFMTTGHSFLPCDRDCALIERKKKGANVYVPSKWLEVTANAAANFEVYLMTTEDFRNISLIEKSLRQGNLYESLITCGSKSPTTIQLHCMAEPHIIYFNLGTVTASLKKPKERKTKIFHQ